ncbi:LOW QUALITY PROTEIN: hypothetical protein FGSG_12770 [Fusarium graminearum PH-1]|uniref:hypothetical protein n=1 Tax=Gibberella zeae (strain ATCC MYA-4620 / CBS 123657 / FGSC 9075 / NRRL 31084 / PH-1) TaxID=229533 RepID=UPI00021F1692|nr:LOW QUALITY PROTEIN: hypothetical protein FGSG_12770 [Fusarium graminearum PH-1]ESU11613.1 LOW QUALITY PROTEIN: hypothetical protein FGSG_12770 [Fusarium graminearum PH-1]|eukprot:XP_011324189.1 LOW QUALITY PROTEIN: hypothetical protein FGSG_12770 [Fusarium graminearum PH-1]
MIGAPVYLPDGLAPTPGITGISWKFSGPEIRSFRETNQTCSLRMVSGPFAETIMNENGDELTTCLQSQGPVSISLAPLCCQSPLLKRVKPKAGAWEIGTTLTVEDDGQGVAEIKNSTARR